MIIYFSATKNSEFAAKKIALATDDRAISMPEIEGDIELKENESLGIVTPVYFWGLPSFVENFLQSVSIKGAKNSYIYCVATYGGTLGQTEYQIAHILREKGFGLSAFFSLKTVDNYTVLFSVNNKEEIKETLKAEAKALCDITERIKRKEKSACKKDNKSRFMCKMARFFYNSSRKTKHFWVRETCIGCGVCEKGCPIGAIKMIDNKPVWIKERCVLCLKCLHTCPKFAVQYDNKTINRGQYIHPQKNA